MHLNRDRVFTWWARTVTSRPRAVLMISLLLAAASIWLTATRLEFHSDRSDLIDSSLKWQQRYVAYKELFPRWNDAVVVIDRGIPGGSAPPSTETVADAFTDALVERLRGDERFAAVNAGFDRGEAPPGMILFAGDETIEALTGQLGRLGPVLASPSLADLLRRSLLAGNDLPAAQRDELRSLLERAEASANGADASVLGIPGDEGFERLRTRSGRLNIVMVSLGLDEEAESGALSERIDALRGHIAALRRAPEFSLVSAGVTGVPVLEADETAQSMRDSTLAGMLSFAIVTALLVIVYRGLSTPLLALGSLLIGEAWSFAWVVLAVGHLQVLSAVFGGVILGLGSATAIHLIARLELVHPDHEHMAEAIAQTFRGVGPGIVTAAVTTAAAFGAMACTSFTGVAEMGIIAAGGVLLCTLSVMCCFPAMLMLLPHPERRIRSRHGGESRPFAGRLGPLLDARPGLSLTIAIVILAGACASATRVRYDTDLLKLMPGGAESVVWEHRLVQDDAQSVWHAVVLARDAAEARRLAERLSAVPHVSGIGGAADFLPGDEDVLRKRELLMSLPDPAPLRGLQRLAPADEVPALRQVLLTMVRAWKDSDPALAQSAGRLAELRVGENISRPLDQYAMERMLLMDRLDALRSAQLPQPNELPASLRELFVGRDGSLLLRIYPHDPSLNGAEAGASVLSPRHLGPFARAVRAIAPDATGPAMQIYYSTQLIQRAYLRAALLAFAAIVILVLIDFRNIADTLCALIPVVCGTSLLLGVMGLAGTDLNFANTIVASLIVGIGVDAGVHAIHRWRRQPTDRPAGLAGGSGRAITLTTMTSAAGFAAMLIAEHRGIRSLGFVMTVGLVMVWAATLLVLPPVLRLRSRRMSR